MPSAPELKQHKNGRYYIHWIEGRRTRRTSTGEREMAAAQRFFGQWLLNDQLAAREERTPALTIEALYILYMEAVAKGTPSFGRAPGIGRYLVAGFGTLTPRDIGQAHVDKYVRDRRAGRIGKPGKDSTIWLELTKLKAAVNYAIKRRKLSAADALDIKLPAPPEPRDRWLREHEVAKLVEVAATLRKLGRLTRTERFIALAVETAGRARVIETLTWDRVDFETGVIHYRQRGDVRSKKKRPSVPISKALRRVLERAYAEKTGDYVLDSPRHIWVSLDAVARRAGIAGVSPHVLRHTSATWMARRGVPLWKIAGVLGNSMRMVEEVYAKHAPDGLVDAVEAISGGRFNQAV